MEMESVRSQLPFSFSPKIFRAVTEKLVAAGVAVREASMLRLPARSVTLNEDEQGTAVRLERLLQEGRFTPREVKELEEQLRVPRKLLTDMLGVMESHCKVVKITTEFYLSSATLE